MTLGNDNGKDGQTDGQTDRRTDSVRRNMRPPPREEGRIKSVEHEIRKVPHSQKYVDPANPHTVHILFYLSLKKSMYITSKN